MDKPVEWLSKVAERHKEWVAIVKSFGEYNYAEDVVQEMYLVLYKYANEEKIIRNGVVSRGYIYFSLRSIIFQLHNSKRKINKVSLDDEEFTYEIPNNQTMDEQIAFHKICTMIDNHIDNWRWYEKRLFELYRDSGLSIRGLAAETNISWVSIYHTLKSAKEEIKEKFSEDYEDYINGDYTQLK